MQNHQESKSPVLVAGIVTSVLSATAAVQTFNTPTLENFPDTESSTNISLVSWRDYTPPVALTLELDATPTNAVQVAFGQDLNGDADLQPEETEYIVGYDCGDWFVREREVERVENVESVESVERGSRTFEFRLAESPTNRWNVAKVTTRGRGDSLATITARLTKPHFYIIIR